MKNSLLVQSTSSKTCLRDYGSKSLRLLISIDTHVDEELRISAEEHSGR